MADILEEFVDKDLLVAGEGKLSRQDGFEILEHFVELADCGLEDGQQVRQAEMRDLVHIWIDIYLERTHCESHIRC